jgi:hypothetical protein
MEITLGTSSLLISFLSYKKYCPGFREEKGLKKARVAVGEEVMVGIGVVDGAGVNVSEMVGSPAGVTAGGNEAAGVGGAIVGVGTIGAEAQPASSNNPRMATSSKASILLCFIISNIPPWFFEVYGADLLYSLLPG